MTSSSSPGSSTRPRSPSTTPGGSGGCAPSGPTRSGPASPATCTIARASPSPTWPSSSTASSSSRPAAPTPPRRSTCCGGTCARWWASCGTRSTTCGPTSPTQTGWPAPWPGSSTRVGERSGLATDLPHRGDGPPAAAPRARAVADRPRGGHQRRAERSREPHRRRCGAATAPPPTSRWPTTADLPRATGAPTGRPASPRSVERAAGIGATLAVVTEPGQGTRVRCTLAGH